MAKRTTSSKSGYVTGTLNGQKQTFTSAEVAKQYGAVVDGGKSATRSMSDTSRNSGSISFADGSSMSADNQVTRNGTTTTSGLGTPSQATWEAIGGVGGTAGYEAAVGGAPTTQTEALNAAQQQTFDALPASTDPTALKSQAAEQFSNTYKTFQDQIKKFQTQQQHSIDSVMSFMEQTAGEKNLQERLNTLDDSFESGQNKIEDQTITMDYIGGQQASVERRYTAQRNSLVRQMQSETASRESKLNAAKFLYDASRNSLSDTIALYQATAPESLGTEVDEATGEMTAIFRNPITGEVTTKNLGRVKTPEKWSSNVENAQAMGVSKPFYTTDGQTIINTQNGREYSNLESWQADGGRPELVERVNALDRSSVLALREEYPDAGIKATDDYATASSKLNSSRIYQDSVRAPGTGGGGGAGIVDSEVETYAQALLRGEIKEAGIPQKLRAQAIKRKEELKSSASSKYETEMDARLDYDNDLRQLEADVKAGTPLPAPSVIISQMMLDYGGKVSQQEIDATVRRLFGAQPASSQAPASSPSSTRSIIDQYSSTAFNSRF